MVNCRGFPPLTTCKLTSLEKGCRGGLNFREFAPKTEQKNPEHFLLQAECNLIYFHNSTAELCTYDLVLQQTKEDFQCLPSSCVCNGQFNPQIQACVGGKN